VGLRNHVLDGGPKSESSHGKVQLWGREWAGLSKLTVNRDLWKDGWFDWDGFWRVDCRVPKEPCITWGPDAPIIWGSLGGFPTHWKALELPVAQCTASGIIQPSTMQKLYDVFLNKVMPNGGCSSDYSSFRGSEDPKRKFFWHSKYIENWRLYKFSIYHMTRSPAVADWAREHAVSWNVVKCCTNVRRIALEKAGNLRMTFMVS